MRIDGPLKDYPNVTQYCKAPGHRVRVVALPPVTADGGIFSHQQPVFARRINTAPSKALRRLQSVLSAVFLLLVKYPK